LADFFQKGIRKAFQIGFFAFQKITFQFTLGKRRKGLDGFDIVGFVPGEGFLVKGERLGKFLAFFVFRRSFEKTQRLFPMDKLV
jgi:hypothetical protein